MTVCPKTTDLAAVRAALPKRPKDANKATFGRVLLISGSDNMRGCAALAALGALRTGAGRTETFRPGVGRRCCDGRCCGAR